VNNETTETKSIPFSGNNAHLPQSPLTQAQYSSEERHDHDLDSVFGPGMREGAKTFGMDGQYVCNKHLGESEPLLPWASLSWCSAFGFFVQPDYAVTTSWLPTSPTTSVMRSTWLVHEDAVEGVDYDVEKVVEIIDITNAQDKELCQLVQTGVNSSGYDNSAPYQPQREGPIRGFLRAYLDHVKDGQPAGGKE
jgi:phenylpropionate dioxygenase-like ring-hydroxylating dioxygenase large terminal subunit